MKVYFLVEGKRTEPILYEKWLSFLLPELVRIDSFIQSEPLAYYLFASGGYPTILQDLLNAIKDINLYGEYDYLAVCLDSDEFSIEEQKNEIYNHLKMNNLELINCQLEIIVQNPCIETWLMGNQEAYPTLMLNKGFEKYQQHYNVAINDPELMDKPDSYHLPKAIYHSNYLTAMLNPKMKYNKSNPPKGILEQQYFSQMQKRVAEKPTHLPSFQSFLQFCEKIKTQMQK